MRMRSRWLVWSLACLELVACDDAASSTADTGDASESSGSDDGSESGRPIESSSDASEDSSDASDGSSSTSDVSSDASIGSSDTSVGCSSTSEGSSSSESSSGDPTTSSTDATTGTDGTTGDPPEPGCGDGIVADDEACDDGDAVNGDGCDDDCTISVVVDLAMGSGHTCVVFDTGAVKCWGAGWSGALGQGNLLAIGDDETPAAIDPIDVGDGVLALDGGSAFSCALTQSEDLRCWGDGDFGQLALGNTLDIGDDELPSAGGIATLAAGSIVHVATGERNACATYDDGEVACWGPSGFGEHGYGNYDTIGDDEAVSTAGFVSIGGAVVQTAVGAGHACALLESQEVVCWGYNSDGRLGYGFVSLGIGDDELPSDAGPVDVGGYVDAITAGDSHTCALFGGLVRCWGSNAQGQLGWPATPAIGDDDTPINFGPVDIEFPITTPTAQIVAGAAHSCALLADGRVRCWGSGGVGQLGYGNTEDIGDDELPSDVGDVDVGGTVVRLAAGGNRTCALLDTGGVRCWGAGFGGLLGYGNTATIGDDEPPSAAGDIELF